LLDYEQKNYKSRVLKSSSIVSFPTLYASLTVSVNDTLIHAAVIKKRIYDIRLFIRRETRNEQAILLVS